MNQEKELLLQLLLEKYGQEKIEYKKPYVVKKRKKQHAWSKAEVEAVRILHFEQGHGVSRISKILDIDYEVVERKLYRLRKEIANNSVKKVAL